MWGDGSNVTIKLPSFVKEGKDKTTLWFYPGWFQFVQFKTSPPNPSPTPKESRWEKERGAMCDEFFSVMLNLVQHLLSYC